MRARCLKSLFDILKTMREACDIGVISACRAGAEGIKNFLLDNWREEEELVSLLGDCEKAELSRMGECLDRIEEALNRVEPSFEMVFVSYKASMSDSLLTIYEAAKADPRCSAIWMPVPYFEMDSVRGLERFVYEGPEAYKGIESTDWTAYSFEDRAPEVVVTFNPYDGNNSITSAHPNFHCERLKRVSGLLVYVPYFVSASDGLTEAFALLPGCRHAGKVAIQSRKMSDLCQEHYERVTGESACGKFEAWGNPKFDMAIRAKKEDFDLPRDWARIAGERPIVLYSTSLMAMLGGSAEYLDKLECVLESFKKRRDVALWWRPHPLSEAAFKSMRPKLAKRHEWIVSSYKAEGWGIYDDTPELHRALARASVYYGDRSSVAALGLAGGKPAMIQEPILKSRHSKVHLELVCLFEDKDRLLLAARGVSALLEAGKELGELKLAGFFPGVRHAGTYPFIAAAELDGKLYFAPFSASRIGVLDLRSGELGAIPYPLFTQMAPAFRFGCCAAHGGFAFFFGSAYPAVIRLDPKTGEMKLFDGYMDDLRRMRKAAEEPSRWLAEGVLVGDEMALPSFAANAIVFFNMETCESRVVEAGSVCFNSAAYGNGWHWLAPARHGNAKAWKPGGESMEFELPHDCDKSLPWHVLFAGGAAWFFASMSRFFAKAEIVDGSLEVRSYPMIAGANGSTMVTMPRNFGDSIYLQAGSGFAFINAGTGEVKVKEYRLSPEDKERICANSIEGGMDSGGFANLEDCLFHEGAAFGLHEFLEGICRNDEVMRKIAKAQKEVLPRFIEHSDGTAGKAIYEEAKKIALEGSHCPKP